MGLIGYLLIYVGFQLALTINLHVYTTSKIKKLQAELEEYKVLIHNESK
jgi:hypothetical protein